MVKVSQMMKQIDRNISEVLDNAVVEVEAEGRRPILTLWLLLLLLALQLLAKHTFSNIFHTG